MKCRHERVTGYMWRDHKLGDNRIQQWAHAFVQPGRIDHHHKVVCDDCGETLPLGPSADSDPRVQLEMRAAEIALGDISIVTTDEERTGWLDHAYDVLPAANPGTPAEWAGYLARQIAQHVGHDTRRSTEGEE